MAAMSLYTGFIPSLKLQHPSKLQQNCLTNQRRPGFIIKCEYPKPSDGKPDATGVPELQIGSPIIVIEAPPTLKTADSISCLKTNSGLVKPGDVGRIVARKPKDVWAVRLEIGTYLIDGKHFKRLDLNE